MKDLRKDYRELSSTYDDLRFAGRNGQFLARADATIIRNLVRRTSARRVVDIPTGTGRVAKYLENDEIRVIGCDLTRAMIELAQRQSFKNAVAFVECDASSLPFADASVECVICLRFFHLFPRCDRPHFVNEFRRIIRPKGHLICSFTNAWYAGGLSLFRRWLGYPGVYFQERGEIADLFPGWNVLALQGNFLPFQYRLTCLGSQIEGFGLKCTSSWPLNHLCWERFYLLEAPDQ
jgi:ubiquinone/menaquinone biosynthesis C-methylase UbiE